MKVITYIQETQDYLTSCFMITDKLMVEFGSACMSDTKILETTLEWRNSSVKNSFYKLQETVAFFLSTLNVQETYSQLCAGF